MSARSIRWKHLTRRFKSVILASTLTTLERDNRPGALDIGHHAVRSSGTKRKRSLLCRVCFSDVCLCCVIWNCRGRCVASLAINLGLPAAAAVHSKVTQAAGWLVSYCSFTSTADHKCMMACPTRPDASKGSDILRTLYSVPTPCTGG